MLCNRSFGLVLATSMTASMAVLAQNAASPKPRQLKANGTDLTFVDQGKGAPIVFVHGAVGDLRFWEPQRAAFAKNHRYVAYTLRYHGTGAWPDAGKQYSTDVHSADLAAFISALKAGPVHLVGLSYGGLLAALVATRDPSLVRSLTLAEPALFELLGDRPEDKQVLDVGPRRSGPMMEPLKAGDSVTATRASGWRRERQFRRRFRQPAGGLASDSARQCADVTAAVRVAVRTGSVRHAARAEGPDAAHPRRAHARLLFPHHRSGWTVRTSSQKVVIPKASHTMSAQNPAAFNSAVLAFVEKRR